MAQVDPFTFETDEKVFRHSVVVGVAFVGHALPDAQRGKPAPKGFRGILDAPVTVENQARAGPFTAYRHVQRGESQLGVDAAGKGVTHNLLGA